MASASLHKIWIAGLAVSIGSAGWALADAELMFGTDPVTAILAGDLFPRQQARTASGIARAQEDSPVRSRAVAQGLQEAAPDVLLNALTQEVIAIIRQDKDFTAGRPMKVAHLVETRILPVFDFAHMTRLAVARNWRLASGEQQTALIAEFKALLVRTYSTALAGYHDQVIEFKPLRQAPGDTKATVRSSIRQPGAPPMTIDYSMDKTPAGWKVYDIKVGGVSLITTYRDTFAESVRRVGVDGLVKALSDKNRQWETKQPETNPRPLAR